MAKRTATAIIAGGALTAAAALIAKRRVDRSNAPEQSGWRRWRVVTIGLPEPEVLVGGAWPQPLQEFADLIEVETRAAPGDRGTELAARPRRAADDADLPGHIRRALRETKQLLETGEIATNEPQPEGHRPATPAGHLIDTIARRSPEEGVL